MPDPPLLARDRPGGARGKTGGGACAQPTSPDGWDLSAEPEETRVLVDDVNGERATEAE
jgi:hypothetical protein